MFKAKFPLVVLLAMGIFYTLPSSATTYYVAKTGSDSNACTQSAPCLTIARGQAVATQAGDIVQVGAGTYNERVTVSRSGSSSAKIIIRGHDGSGCPTTVNSDVNSRGFRPAPTVTVQGFSIKANYVSMQCFKVTGTSGVGFDVASGVTDVDITDNYVDGMGAGTPWVGINMPDGMALSSMPANVYGARNYITRTVYGILVHCKSGCLFEDNEIERMVNDSTSDTGADMDYTRIFGSNITMRHNYLHGNTQPDCKGADCHMDCFQSWNIGQTGELAYNITLDRNTCFNANEGIIVRDTTSGAAGSYSSHYNWTITNNIIGQAPGSDSRGMPWVGVFEHVGNVVFENNTLTTSITGWFNGTQATNQNNIYYATGWQPYTTSMSGWSNGSATSDHNLLYQSGQTYSGYSGNTLNQDPKFVNASGLDFHLQSSSPAKDTGTNLTSIGSDHDGNARPQGSGWDMGSYEYGTSTVQKPNPPTGLTVTVN